ILAGFRFLPGQDECRFVGFAVAWEATLCRSVVRPVVSGVVSGSEVVILSLLAIEIAAAAVARSNGPQLSEERRLLPEVAPLLVAEEHIEAVGVARAVMTGEALDAHAKEHAPNLGGYPVNPVQTVQTSVIVAIGKRPIAGRSLADWIKNGHRCRETPPV